MNLRKYYFKLFRWDVVNRAYIRTPAVFESIVSADPAKLFIFVVAFNDVELIDLQCRSLKKYLRDPYEYFVVDNSNKEDRSEKIKAFCFAQKISYVRLPKNPGRDGSSSNGFALNWIYANLIQRLQSRAFGFVDHDLMAVGNISVKDKFSFSDSWGVISYHPTFSGRPRFSWWAGCAFFQMSHFGSREDGQKNKAPNFLPAWGLDTGGRIALDPKIVLRLPEIYGHPSEPNVIVAPGIGLYQFGSFVHFGGASDEREGLTQQKFWMEGWLNK